MSHTEQLRKLVRERVFSGIEQNDVEMVSRLNVSTLSVQGLPAPRTHRDLSRFVELATHPNLLPETRSLIKALRYTYDVPRGK